MIPETPEEHGADAFPSATHGPRSFVTTDWSLVVLAADAETSEGRAALEGLCRNYWLPLYRYARWRGLPVADAEDLTQGFFEDLLSRGAIARADATRGRFRTFLLTSFKHFHSHQRVGASSQKRGGGLEIVSLESMRELETKFPEEPATPESPENSYDREWAARLLGLALAALQREYAAIGKTALFDELKTVLWGGRGQGSYAEIAARLAMTEGALKVAAYRFRQRFGDKLRAEVARTVLNPRDTEDELRHLLAAVSA